MMNYMNNESYSSLLRSLPTLYRNSKDSERSLNIVQDLLRDDQGASNDISVDEDGFMQINDVVRHLRSFEGLEYVNITHVVELFFKDAEKKILINKDNRIKMKKVIFVKPPEVLYFGTLRNLRDRMVSNGIRSNTKGYLKLYSDADLAKKFASKFATDPDDYVVTIAIDAEKAFSEGLKFSTYIDDQFIVAYIDKKYIIKDL